MAKSEKGRGRRREKEQSTYRHVGHSSSSPAGPEHVFHPRREHRLRCPQAIHESVYASEKDVAKKKTEEREKRKRTCIALI